MISDDIAIKVSGIRVTSSFVVDENQNEKYHLASSFL
jgi:hypothetical protein